jgi:hypothetical protein
MALGCISSVISLCVYTGRNVIVASTQVTCHQTVLCYDRVRSAIALALQFLALGLIQGPREW